MSSRRARRRKTVGQPARARKVSLATRPRRRPFSAYSLVYSFLILIFVGALLLWSPISSARAQFTGVVDALFTATSAVCVAGLVVVDTAHYWNLFGQIVILLLIQLGGLGIMTGVTLVLLGMRRRIGLHRRLLIGQTYGQGGLGGALSLLRRTAVFVLLTEAAGALVLFFRFLVERPAGEAAWLSAFQSVSAFNNAGFTIFPDSSSLQAFRGDVVVVLTTAILVILGGISFVVLNDIRRAGDFRRLLLDSKIVLVTTGVLLLFGWGMTMMTEYSNPATIGPLALPGKLLATFFHSVTLRTAGFTTLDIAAMVPFTLLLSMILMFIGGATGSTAGGIKVNSFGVLMAAIWSTLRGQQTVGAFHREIDDLQVRRALAIALLPIPLLVFAGFLLSLTETAGLLPISFEIVSAFGTVGLSTGITPGLSTVGKLTIASVIFIGRLGPIALAAILVQRERPSSYREPRATIRIG